MSKCLLLPHPWTITLVPHSMIQSLTPSFFIWKFHGFLLILPRNITKLRVPAFFERKRRNIEWKWLPTFDHRKSYGEKKIIISNEMVPFILEAQHWKLLHFYKTQWAKKQSIFAKYYSVLPILFIHTIRFSVQYFSTFVLYL